MFYSVTLLFEGPYMDSDDVRIHIRNAVASEPGHLHPDELFAHIERHSVKVSYVQCVENEDDL